MRDSAHMTLTAYAARRGVTKMAVSKAVSSGRLTASVYRDEKGRPWITDPDLADREWAGATDLSKAPGYIRERAEQQRPPPAAPPAPAPVPLAEPSTPRARGAPPAPPPVDPGEAPPPAIHEGMTLSEATAAEKFWKAKHAELKFREAAGELVPAADVAAKLVNVFTQCKTRLLGVPSRARQALPHLTVADIGVLEGLVREALEDLASAAEGQRG